MFLYAGLLTMTIAFVTNWLALIPWRRVRNQHWTEQARYYFPVAAAATSNVWTIPAVTCMASALIWPETASRWPALAFIAGTAVIIGTIPMTREVFPRVGWPELLRQATIGWLLRFLHWVVFLGAAVLMPFHFDATVFLIFSAVVLLLWVWNRGLWLYTGQKLGYITAPPERLQNIVKSTAEKMNLPIPTTYLFQSPSSQAYALPNTRSLLFSKRMLEILSDDELACVCAHEMGHVTESRAQYRRRYLQWLVFLPWLLFKPLVGSWHLAGMLVLVGNSAALPHVCRRFSHKMEVRADQIAASSQGDPAVYARALLRIYEDNLAPAVVAREHLSHPHLYDRMLAAGVTPDFPRPKPAASTAWHGVLFSAALGFLAMTLAISIINR